MYEEQRINMTSASALYPMKPKKERTLYCQVTPIMRH